ncbi:MAG TPA: LPS export ABC transporter ATP-binding protein [Myxococcaceae bacterium]|nr:LPS export ABC transporter ATP-binding protein [Myxococcaceae bacterium]
MSPPTSTASAPRGSEAPDTASALVAEGLVKRYRRRTVVAGVSLVVRPGEVVGLLGPNGAGKTTSFNMVVGLVRPDGGRVTLDGRDLTHLPMHRRARVGLGYLPQEASIFRRLTVRQNFLAVLELQRLSRAERHERAEALLAEFGLTHVADSLGETLSGGERRRAEIARSLIPHPRFILFDEPFAGVDPINVHDLQRQIAALRERGLGVLITDHNVQDTLGICDRAYLIAQGDILEEGTPQALAESPKARAIYLGERFRLAPAASSEGPPG